MILKLEAWQESAIARFGGNTDHWRFICPACHHPQSGEDFRRLGMMPTLYHRLAGHACIGRWNGEGCRHDGGGPVVLDLGEGEGIRRVFEFAPPCDHCNDDGVVCERCDRRLIDCQCPAANPHDCPECRT